MSFSVMKQYMADIDMPAIISGDFMSRIPKQRAMINDLMQKGVILSYTLSGDRSKLWVILLATDGVEARKLIETFPLYEYLQCSIYELAFHNNRVNKFPELSMN